MKKTEALISTLQNLMASMPMNENEIADVVKDMVKTGTLVRSAPPSESNYFILQALFTINKEIRRSI